MSRESLGKEESRTSRKDIWNLALKLKKGSSAAAADEGVETTIMVVGNKQTGKSSLIHRMQNKDDIPPPTSALEYRFARSTRGTIKDVAHIWELAGGTHLTDLIDVPINESNIHLTTFVIVLDLSEPAEALPVLEHFLDKIQMRAKKVLDGLEARGSKRPKGLRAFALKKYGSDHPDISSDAMYICPVPIVIVGAKYDLFRDMEPEKRKLLCKTLRFLAHTQGATLVFANLKDETSCAKVRRILNHHAFRSNPLQELSHDYNKPLVITAGQDTFSQIGNPPSEAGGKGTIGKQSFAGYDKWRNDFDRYFPKKRDTSSQVEAIDFTKFKEPRVDAMRAQKDEELERMRRMLDKKIPIKEILSGVAGTSLAKNAGGGNGKGYSRAKAMGLGL
ncbi:Cytoplasmic dynein 2 light intermediate chain 1 [Chytriomyces hyalinus]|nr:Cytoplasmic dynein 2 light intermediate chain 1 [Chytriomyces hyalinus]